MAAKNVTVVATMGEGFKIESQIRDHAVAIDQPQAAGGTDTGPTPLEYFFFSLAGCIGSIARIMANQRRLAIRSMQVTVSGELDMDVLLGKNTDDRAGFQGVDIKVSMDSDLSADEASAFLQEVERRCPVSDNIMSGTPVTIELA